MKVKLQKVKHLTFLVVASELIWADVAKSLQLAVAINRETVHSITSLHISFVKKKKEEIPGIGLFIIDRQWFMAQIHHSKKTGPEVST